MVNYWGGEIKRGHVSHTSAKYSPEIAANPHTPGQTFAHPDPTLFNPLAYAKNLTYRTI